MMLGWVFIALASMTGATLLALADGALLAGARAGQRVPSIEPERAHRALSLVRMLAHLLTGVAACLAISERIRFPNSALAIGVVLVMLNVALVEAFARDAGQRRGRLGGVLTAITRVVDVVFRPVTALGRALERMLGHFLPAADDVSAQRVVAAERFREVVTAEAGVTAAEEELLHGVFSLGDTEVREIMVPRVNVVGIERQTPWSEVVDRVSSSEHARFPVYEETLDNVVGVIYAKDLLAAVVAGEEPASEWVSLMRPPVFIPGTKRIDRQLRDFKHNRTHIALVADEYGGTAGLVTIEDILEEIVGEIRDEYDEEEPAVEQEENTRFWVSGIMTLADLSELLGVDFQRDDLTTVGGLVYDAFGHVPRAGETRTMNGFKMVVERVRRRRIERVYFERLGIADARETRA
jgi:putative hemolysin